MMKIAVMAIALVMGSLAFGQQTKAVKSPEERAHNLTTKMTKQLSLTTDQAAKIAEINVGIAQKNENIRTATNIAPEQKVEILKSNHEARMSMYKGVLTTDQYTKCEEFEKNRAARRAERKASGSATTMDEDEL